MAPPAPHPRPLLSVKLLKRKEKGPLGSGIFLQSSHLLALDEGHVWRLGKLGFRAVIGSPGILFLAKTPSVLVTLSLSQCLSPPPKKNTLEILFFVTGSGRRALEVSPSVGTAGLCSFDHCRVFLSSAEVWMHSPPRSSVVVGRARGRSYHPIRTLSNPHRRDME